MIVQKWQENALPELFDNAKGEYNFTEKGFSYRS
jgi:hypothetical protein